MGMPPRRAKVPVGRVRTGTAQWPGWGSCPRPRAGDGRRRPRKGTWGEGGPGQGAHRSGPHLSHCNGVQHPHTWLPVGTEGTVFLVTSCRGGGTGRRLQVQSPPALSPAGLPPLGAVRRHHTPARPGFPTPALPLAEGPCGWRPPQLSRTLRTAGPWPCPVPHFEFGDVWASVGVSSRNTVALTPETKRGPAPSRGHSVLPPGRSERGFSGVQRPSSHPCLSISCPGAPHVWCTGWWRAAKPVRPPLLLPGGCGAGTPPGGAPVRGEDGP